MPANIYTHSHFSPDEFGNGGCKRTAQIRELLNKHNVCYNIADFTPFNPKSRSLSLYLKGIAYQKKMSLSINEDHHIGRHLRTFEKFAAEKKPSLFIWESVMGHQLLLAKALHSNKIPFIALPHNIESLVKGSKSFTSGVKSPRWFSEEIRYLGYSNKVFTISHEEQWLLSLYDIEADYLPYYPTEKVKSYLLDIRTERESKLRAGSKKDILLLGTFFNGPTIQGYIDLLNNISKFDDLSINIVGFGSEVLKKHSSSKIRVWGSVDNETLRGIMIANDIAIIHQPPTTGALTKIPELLIAGIPILANHTASRSYMRTEGLTTYYNYQELCELIYSKPLTVSPVPQEPAGAEKRFIEAIGTFF